MRISIAGKICFVLLMIFSFVLLGLTAYQARLEHCMILQLAKEEASHQMVAMLANQSIGRLMHKPTATQETRLKENTLITGQVIYQPHSSTSTAYYEIEQGAWRGENMEQQLKQGEETLLILASPFYLDTTTNSYQLAPSQAGEKPIGIVRITYSLTQALAEIEQHLLMTALLLCLFFGAGVLLALYIVRRQIVAPLLTISVAMERAADLGDYRSRLSVVRNDELGRLNENFNHLMQSLDTDAYPKR